MKIVFLDKKTIGETPNFEKLKQLGEIEVYETTTASETISRLTNADVCITNKVILNANVLEACPKLKLICIAATGTNNIDMEYAAHKGISVRNVVGYSTQSVAQHTFASLFYLMEQLAYYDNYVKSGQYCKNDIFTHLGRSYAELNGKNFGIIGLGNIGRQVAKIATAFGANVSYFSTSGKNNNPDYAQLSLNELLVQSDMVSIHAPLNEDTYNLINYKNIPLMKKTAYLLNMGRGGIINECDLATAIEGEMIAGAAIDVMEQEPLSSDNCLMKISKKERLLITPHIAWASIEARKRLIDGIISNIEEFLRTK